MRCLLPLFATGCVFITAADREARRELLTEADTGSLLGDDDDDTVGDDDDDTTPFGDDDDDDGSYVPGEWREVSVGTFVACAIDDRYDLSCWGTYADEGDWNPVVPEDPDFVGVSMGTSVGCAWDGEGDTWCFGPDIGDEFDRVASVIANPGTFPDGVVCGASECCGLDDGAVSCWNTEFVSDFRGIDDDGTKLSHLPPVDALAGHGDWCALSDGQVDCFTTSSTGGHDPSGGPKDPDWTRIYAGASQTVCMVEGDSQKVHCFNPSASFGLTPMSTPDADVLQQLQVSGDHNYYRLCGLQAGNLACWDQNGTVEDWAPDIPDNSWSKLSMNGYDGCVISSEKQLACWGGLGGG